MRLVPTALGMWLISAATLGQTNPSSDAASSAVAAFRLSFDQSSDNPSPAPDVGPNPIESNSPASDDVRRSGIRWCSFLREWWFNISVEQSERILQQKKTRDQLNGRFFHDWFSDVDQYSYNQWNDGDKFATSNLAHPLQGAIIEAIFWQNDDRVRFSAQDLHSPAYRKALLQAFVWASIDAVQWKLGPVSEATIGHVGLPAHWWDIPSNCKEFNLPCHSRTGLNDLVMNEVGGTALTIGFQWLDKRIQVPLESQSHSRVLINKLRILSNPPQSIANLYRFRKPWYRDNRD